MNWTAWRCRPAATSICASAPPTAIPGNFPTRIDWISGALRTPASGVWPRHPRLRRHVACPHGGTDCDREAHRALQGHRTSRQRRARWPCALSRISCISPSPCNSPQRRSPKKRSTAGIAMAQRPIAATNSSAISSMEKWPDRYHSDDQFMAPSSIRRAMSPDRFFDSAPCALRSAKIARHTSS